MINKEFVTWEAEFKKQMLWWFKRIQGTAADRIASLGLGLRSDERDNMLVDKDAPLCNVTNQRHLGRYHFEDLLQVQSGTQLVLYLKTNKRSTIVCPNIVLKPFEAHTAQQGLAHVAVGGEEMG